MRYLYKVHAMPCFLETSRRGAFLAMCLYGYIAYTKHCGGKGKFNSPFASNGVWTSKTYANLEPCDLLECLKTFQTLPMVLRGQLCAANT